MITRVSSINSNNLVYLAEKKQAPLQKISNQNLVSDPIKSNITGVPRGYINFKSSSEEHKATYTPDAIELIQHARDIAIQHNHKYITPFHIVQAGVEEELALTENSKKKNPESAQYSSMGKLVSDIMKFNIYSKKKYANMYRGAVAQLGEVNQRVLNQLTFVDTPEEITKDASTENSAEDNLPKLSTDMVEKIEEMTAEQDLNLDASSFLAMSLSIMGHSGVLYAQDFCQQFASLANYRDGDEVMEKYLSTYDNRAIDLWNKLALGSSVFVLYNHPEEVDRLTASLINTQGEIAHGKFKGDNTSIYLMQPEVAPESLLQEITTTADAEDEVKNKQNIFVVDFYKLLQTATDTEKNEINFANDIFPLLDLEKENTRLILSLQSDEYDEIMKNPALKKHFQKFITYTIPPMHSYEAKEIINSNKKMLKSVKTPYTKEARDKAIMYADKMTGIYPDKAVDLMKRVADYYGDSKSKITVSDVDEFVEVAKDLFQKDRNIYNIVYDTGKDLNSLYGKETTKKDVEGIIKQIKSGKIGTKGFIIYSKDEEAGSGRRHTAQVIAGEAKIPFIEISSANFATANGDDGDERVNPSALMHQIFNDAKKSAEQNENKTAMIFVNNFEELAFSNPYLPGYKQAMAQLSSEIMEAQENNLNILVIGSTDEYFVDEIPKMVKGFSQTISVDSPAFNKQSREDILTNKIAEMQLPLDYKKGEKKQFIDKLVKLTEYMSFVQIRTLMDKTQQIMEERNKQKASIGEFIEAYLQLATGRTSRPEMPEYNKQATTSHECGHATNLEVMSNLFAKKGKPWHQSRNVNFITLDPRGDFLGAVFEGRSENQDYPFEAMFTDLVCAYGGYSCEKMFFDMDGSSGISQDLAQASTAAKRGIEYFGFGYNTGKISNAPSIASSHFQEDVFTDMKVILTNAEIVSDLITENYKKFNEWFTSKFSKLIGTDDCMISGDDFRKALASWEKAQPQSVKEELDIMGDMILDIIKASKNGKIYPRLKKMV